MGMLPLGLGRNAAPGHMGSVLLEGRESEQDHAGLQLALVFFSLEQRDRGSTTSLSSDFSLGMESSPGAAGSFTYEAVELMPAGAQAQAAW